MYMKPAFLDMAVWR